MRRGASVQGDENGDELDATPSNASASVFVVGAAIAVLGYAMVDYPVFE